MATTLFLLFPTLIASIYGLAVIFPRTRGLYYRVPVFSMICTCVGQLSYFVILLTENEFNSVFNVGVLGPLGACMFLIVANAGATARFIDERDTANRRHRIIALIAPLTVIFIFVSIIFAWKSTEPDIVGSAEYISTVIQLGATCVATALTVYYTFKAAILNYPKESFAGCMRPYNIVMTLILVLLNAEIGLRFLELKSDIAKYLLYGFYSVLALLIIISMPLLERGRKKFLTL